MKPINIDTCLMNGCSTLVTIPLFKTGRIKNNNDRLCEACHARIAAVNPRSTPYGYISHLVRKAEERSVNKNLPFELTPEYIFSIWPEDDSCWMAKAKFFSDPAYKRQSPTTPTIDRLIPSEGYVEGNIQIVSWVANGIMGAGSPEQLVTIAHSLLEVYDV